MLIRLWALAITTANPSPRSSRPKTTPSTSHRSCAASPTISCCDNQDTRTACRTITINPIVTPRLRIPPMAKPFTCGTIKEALSNTKLNRAVVNPAKKAMDPKCCPPTKSCRTTSGRVSNNQGPVSYTHLTLPTKA